MTSRREQLRALAERLRRGDADDDVDRDANEYDLDCVRLGGIVDAHGWTRPNGGEKRNPYVPYSFAWREWELDEMGEDADG